VSYQTVRSVRLPTCPATRPGREVPDEGGTGGRTDVQKSSSFVRKWVREGAREEHSEEGDLHGL
jgi:hypothetical protein